VLPAVLCLFHGGGGVRRLGGRPADDDSDVDRLSQLYAEPVPLSAVQRRVPAEVSPHAWLRAAA